MLWPFGTHIHEHVAHINIMHQSILTPNISDPSRCSRMSINPKSREKRFRIIPDDKRDALHVADSLRTALLGNDKFRINITYQQGLFQKM